MQHQTNESKTIIHNLYITNHQYSRKQNVDSHYIKN
jgi:hypothetical protein